MSTATISCSTPDAIIRYEIGGADPTEQSPLYSSPVEFAGEIRAKAWKEGMVESDIAVAVAEEEDEMTRIEIPYSYSNGSPKFCFEMSRQLTLDEMRAIRNSRNFGIVIEYDVIGEQGDASSYLLKQRKKTSVKFYPIEVEFSEIGMELTVSGETTGDIDNLSAGLLSFRCSGSGEFALDTSPTTDGNYGFSTANWNTEGNTSYPSCSLYLYAGDVGTSANPTPSETSGTDMNLHCYIEY